MSRLTDSNNQNSHSFSKLAWGYLVGVSSVIAVILFAIMLVRTLELFSHDEVSSTLSFFLSYKFWMFVAVGFIAQIVDGALGMAYGVTSTSFLLGAGVSPSLASAGVHTAEVFTTAISGLSHWRFGNIDFVLFRRLLIPGAIGAGIGAYLLSSFDTSMFRLLIAIYLLVMGVVILSKAFRVSINHDRRLKRVGLLAFIGGFADATGGGGWGPIVTTTLIGRGNHPRTTIGTVNASEFLVALTAAGTFTFMLGSGSWTVVIGLITGGVLAAPLGAYICNRINVRRAMYAVGVLIILLSTRTILKTLECWPFT
jgi:uncharacterized membrane protein YfcA